MTTTLYYIGTVLIWGSTWLAITFQLGKVPPALSVSYRFFLAALIGYIILQSRKNKFKLSKNNHLWIALQGLLLFGINYVLMYYAEQYISSGLVCVVFSTFVAMNIINSWIFFKKPISLPVTLGSVLGLTGIALVFRNEFTSFEASKHVVLGFVLTFIGTYSASLGNMVALRNKLQGIPIFTSNTYGMFYGAILTFLFASLTGPITFELSFRYISSMLYLAIFGSIVAFFLYVSLIAKIGADRAGYAAVAFPIVALALSTVFENYQWTPAAALGVVIILLGNFLVLYKKA